MSDRTITRRNLNKGDPLPYRRGHAGGAARRRVSISSEMWAEEDRGYTTPCWIWKQTPKNRWGHCSVWINGTERSAHRAMYEQEVGPIPNGLQLDHLCRQPRCVRPTHLEPVTHAENTRRSAAAKLTHEAADFIRASDLPQKALAEMFGVRREAIGLVRRGITWT